MDKLTLLQKRFGIVKKAGADGERLAAEVKTMIQKMDIIIAEFEAGMQSETWAGNFQAFGGEDAIEFGTAVYMEVKTAREKLKLLGI